MADHHHHDNRADDATSAELLDLEGQVTSAYWADAMDWVVGTAARTDGRILDLGAGSGVGTIELARRFEGAEILALDSSTAMLDRIRTKAHALGFASRVRTVHADLDEGWPATGPLDLTWASLSLHHVADPDRVLREVHATTTPDGLIAVAEMDEQLRLLPDDLGIGRPGLEDRCLEILRAEHAHALPELGSQWAPRLEAAGFVVLDERTFTIAVDGAHEPAVHRYADGWLRQLAAGLADRLDPDDRQALSQLLDGDGPHALPRRDDLIVRGTRTVTLARRGG